ncbi:P-loop containing nucleoside triphosphate hydrolase [Brevundimonas phage vB_BpoS-Papperlapapp]|uniref:P-loop containing nucleoside triphosphate hydrolase n=1 Tax=Brevundimonas phage vB_BpoS-Domovoi TaxID=2948598 RepID=A0A9E7SKQ7_9CAUD|nr:P-loop containing nucleoside triphosphate hydrolase [Brevundimonas phage vB_BpoS-Domovoi]USN15825.1 P-loop containing nucleoside triphosphate hydrolase [Brevundimonas phage vB_BpoS-Papperlapapp]
MTDKNQTCEVTVTVSGAAGSGKSTLMAVLAQALSGAGHSVEVPEGTPSTTRAISDLSRPYHVTFREAKPGVETLTVVVDAKDIADELEGYVERTEGLAEALTAARQEAAEASARAAQTEAKLGEFRQALIERSKELSDLRDRIPSPAKAEAMITEALTYARESAIIERDRQEVVRRTEDLKTESAKMRDEAEARLREAHALLTCAMTGERPRAKTATDVALERRAAARQLSAADKLALANGARPVTSAEQVVAAGLDDHAKAVGDSMANRGARASIPRTSVHQNEVTLASEIERGLDKDTLAHPVIAKLMEGRG